MTLYGEGDQARQKECQASFTRVYTIDFIFSLTHNFSLSSNCINIRTMRIF